MDPYRTKEWAAFRAEVIRLDGNKCLRCGRGPDDGVILQVNHKQYLQDRKPWEYPYDLCETICKGCHAASHGLIPPKFGWEFAGYDDLGDLDGRCEFCGTEIRYVFLIDHQDWRPMEVGEICCDNLTSTRAASNLMESKRRYADRLKRFISSSRWRPGEKGIEFIRQGKTNVEVVPLDNAFKLRIESYMGKKLYPTLIDAKAKAFELIESGEIKKFLSKHGIRPP